MTQAQVMAIRVIGSIVVVVIAIIASAYLLVNKVEVPAAYWGIAGVAVGGIVGAAGGAAIEARSNGR